MKIAPHCILFFEYWLVIFVHLFQMLIAASENKQTRLTIWSLLKLELQMTSMMGHGMKERKS